jgi:hypothetical protein
VVRENRFLRAALGAAERGWHVFPLIVGGKTPAVQGWEREATTDRRRIRRWWSGGARNNVGIATGRSGLVVIDLDVAAGQCPPPEFVGAQGGRQALEMLAARAGESLVVETFEVGTPSGGSHWYFAAPPGVELRNTAGSVAWKVDSRAHGGYCVAAGSVAARGEYRVMRAGRVAALPGWLLEALTPPRPVLGAGSTSAPVVSRSRRQAGAYVRAIVDGETRAVLDARTGTRHHTLLRAARRLGQLVGGGELGEEQARAVLLEAAAGHVGVDGCTVSEIVRTVEDGLSYGRRLPRRVRRSDPSTDSGSAVKREPETEREAGSESGPGVGGRGR